MVKGRADMQTGKLKVVETCPECGDSSGVIEVPKVHEYNTDQRMCRMCECVFLHNKDTEHARIDVLGDYRGVSKGVLADLMQRTYNELYNAPCTKKYTPNEVKVIMSKHRREIESNITPRWIAEERGRINQLVMTT